MAETVKCLVWDLDGTLWQGTLLEDGEVHLPEEVRKVVIELDSRGILQSVASRNDHEHAWARLEAFGVAEYFVLPEIGWGAKSESVRRIADRLNFALTTMAFVDDRPAERAEVAFHLPDVRCYPAEQVLALPELPEFTPATSTVDSRRRRRMYQAGFRREAERAAAPGSDEEFLRSLDLRMRIGRATGEELSRVEELTLRTSQMNATGVHYPDAVLRGLITDPRHEVLAVTLADRFGPHGAVGVLLLERHPGLWHLKLLATSCRVVAYGNKRDPAELAGRRRRPVGGPPGRGLPGDRTQPDDGDRLPVHGLRGAGRSPVPVRRRPRTGPGGHRTPAPAPGPRPARGVHRHRRGRTRPGRAGRGPGNAVTAEGPGAPGSAEPRPAVLSACGRA